MKTAISLDDDLLKEADRTARRMRLSRSRLISTALREYLRQRRREEIVEQLNRVYGNDPDPEEKRMAPLYKAAFARTLRDKW